MSYYACKMHVVTSEPLNDLLTRRRSELGYTRREMSLRVNVIERSILNWELDHALPQPKHYEGICAAYDINRSVLLGAIQASRCSRGGSQ